MTVAASQRRPPGLPRELDSFVGRRQDLDAVRRHLGRTRLVTLTGPGGVGKTRLALRAAALSVKAFPDGVWLVELGQLVSELGLESFALRALGAVDVADAPDLDQLVDYISDRQLLLVLDNCEHVVEAAAAAAHALLRSCPGLRILATSREALGVAGEQPFEVAPLTLPEDQGAGGTEDAMSLFADRAAAAVPDFAINDENRGTVERIVTQLDGLPLAIELAALKLRAMSAAELADQLADRYRLLTQGNRTAPSRHQTLRLCVEWGYQQCTDREQLMWDRLSVFVGGFEIDAVEGVVASGDDAMSVEEVFDLLGSLVAKSIVTRSASPDNARFRLLETMRQYGLEQLEARGELELIRTRHRDWYVALVQQSRAEVIGPEQAAWWSRLDREQANLRAASELTLARVDGVGAANSADARLLAELVAASFPYWTSRAMFTEARTWIERALQRTAGSPSPLRVQLLADDAHFAVLQGNPVRAAELVRQAETEALALDDGELTPCINYARGLMALIGGDFSTALSEALVAAGQQRGNDDELGLTLALLVAVGALSLQGRIDAHPYYDEGMLLLESRGENYHRGHLLCDKAIHLMIIGELEEARTAAGRSMRLQVNVGDRLGFNWGLAVAAICEGLLGQHERATVLGAAADRAVRDLGLPPPMDQIADAHQGREESARHALGTLGFQTAYDRGWSMDPEARNAYALGQEASASTTGLPRGAATPSLLTQRELEVAALVAEGLPNREIGLRLFITPRTVRGHIENIMIKLGVNTRAAIASWYVAGPGRT